MLVPLFFLKSVFKNCFIFCLFSVICQHLLIAFHRRCLFVFKMCFSSPSTSFYAIIKAKDNNLIIKLDPFALMKIYISVLLHFLFLTLSFLSDGSSLH